MFWGIYISVHCIFYFDISDVPIWKKPDKFEDFGGYADPKDFKRETYLSKQLFFFIYSSGISQFCSTP